MSPLSGLRALWQTQPAEGVSHVRRTPYAASRSSCRPTPAAASPRSMRWAPPTPAFHWFSCGSCRSCAWSRLPVLPAERPRDARAYGRRGEDVHRRPGQRLQRHAVLRQRGRDAPVQPVDATLPPGARAVVDQRLRGADFAGFTAGQHRADPARHLHLRGQGRATPQAAGATARRSSSTRASRAATELLIGGTLGDAQSRSRSSAPSFADGDELAAHAGRPVTLRVDDRRPTSETRTTCNVIAETRRRRPEQRRHGRRPPRPRRRRARHQRQRLAARATILEIADADGQAQHQAAATRSASPGGAPRSRACSARRTTSTSLPDAEREQDRAIPELRHGRLAELRPLRLRRRRLRRHRRRPGPAGSAQIETLFDDYFAGQGLATEPTAFDGRSDYGPFIAVGIPAGGLFTGAEGIKTAEEAAIYGGTAGAAVRPLLPPGLRHDRAT